jgi:segregation and condensation protein B
LNAPQIVEAVLFASDAPLSPDEIARADEQLDEDRVEEALQALQAEYDDAQRAFQLVEVAGGYQILTRPEYAPYLERFDNVPRPSRLSGPSIETLAIIAYRQPIGRLEIEYVRGVGASGVIRTLQERRLIDVVGRAKGLGRPLLYGTTTHFLEHFGFKSLEGLPRPEELPIILRERLPLGPVEEESEGEEGSDEQESLPLDGGDADNEAVADTPADGDDPAHTDADGPTDSVEPADSADLADPVSDDDAIEDDDAIGADDTGSEALAAGGDDVASDEDEPRTDSVD